MKLINTPRLFDLASRRNVSFQFVFLDGKSSYASMKVENEIRRIWNGYASKSKKLIYVFDVDCESADTRKLNKEIEAYCAKSPYDPDIVWFKKNIECNFLGKSVKKSEKKRMASLFYATGKLVLSNDFLWRLTHLNLPTEQNSSNVLYVLSKYLKLDEDSKKLVLRNIEKHKRD